jgi:hypothetical protein
MRGFGGAVAEVRRQRAEVLRGSKGFLFEEGWWTGGRVD